MIRSLPSRFTLALLTLSAFATACDRSPVELAAPDGATLAEPATVQAPRQSFIPMSREGLAKTLLPMPDRPVRHTLPTTAAAAPATVGPPNGFPVVFVRTGHGAGHGQAPIVDNFADAVARVKDGGTIRVDPGTYVVDSVTIDKAVTIESTGGRPFIHNDQARISFYISGQTSGSVTFRGLDFAVTPGLTNSILMWDGFNDVLVEDCDFDVTDGRAGVEAGSPGDGDGHVIVRNSSFHGGELGTFVYLGTTLDVEGSSFSGHTFGGIQYQAGAFGTIEDNDIGPCGWYGCVRIFASQVDAVGNRLTESRTDVDGFYHNLVIYSAESTGTVSGNDFDGCGLGQCVLSIRNSDLTVDGNTFTIYPDQGTRFAIAVSDGFGGTLADVSQFAASITATDNVIRAAPGSTVGDRNDQWSYALKFGAMLVENGGTLRAYRNTVENADAGIVLAESNPNGVSGSDGGTLEGSDNAISLVRMGLAVWGSSQADFRSNDITDYVVAIAEGGRDEPSDLTCNWWGSASGPSAVQSWTDPTLYTPWATSPVAGSSTTVCSGGA